MKMYLLYVVMLLSFPVLAEEKGNNLLEVGIWEVVELQPKANDPLKDETIYMVFLPNGILIDVASSKKEPTNTTSVLRKYSFEGDILKIENAQNDISEHVVKQVNGQIQITVPFGRMVVRKAPNKSLKSGTPQSGAP